MVLILVSFTLHLPFPVLFNSPSLIILQLAFILKEEKADEKPFISNLSLRIGYTIEITINKNKNATKKIFFLYELL